MPCDHAHGIFTILHELLGLWQANRKRLSDHLFRVSRDTLFELLEHDRYLGARPGILAALHLWGRTLTLYPHIHCLVTGGGRAADGGWRAARGAFLLPVRVVRALFRGKLLAWLGSDLEDGRLVLPDGILRAELERPCAGSTRRPGTSGSSNATPTVRGRSSTWPATSEAARSGIADS